MNHQWKTKKGSDVAVVCTQCRQERPHKPFTEEECTPLTLEQCLILDKVIHVQSKEFRDLMEAIAAVTGRFGDTAEWKITTPTGAVYPLAEIFGRCVQHLSNVSQPFLIASVPDAFRDQSEPETGRIDPSKGPRCAVCGADVYHSLLYGYRCTRDSQHMGIKRP